MDFTTVQLTDLIVHQVGLKDRGEELLLADKPLQISDGHTEELIPFFLRRFEFAYEQYRFENPAGFPNPICESVRSLFENEAALPEASAVLARNLYDAVTHPKVKPGELVVARFSEYPFDGRTVRAVGIFKMENKAKFLEVIRPEHSAPTGLMIREGVDMLKTDKGCLVLEAEAENGYVVLLTDPNNRGTEARYWKENFLGLRQRSTNYSQTNTVLSAAREFVSEAGETMEPAEKMELLNRSVSWFQDREVFQQEEFEQEVFQDEETIQSFRRYARERAPEMQEEFEISAPAVKKQARVFKSVLKLDRNFHIYIHGSRELIQRGVEADGRKFYKIYFSEES